MSLFGVKNGFILILHFLLENFFGDDYYLID